MLYKPNNFNASTGTSASDIDFTTPPWYVDSYCIFSEPLQPPFVETISGSFYDIFGSNNATKRWGQIRFTAMYVGTQVQIATVADGLDVLVKGAPGSLRLDIPTSATARYDTIAVRCVDIGLQLPFQVENLVTARFTFVFQQLGDAVGTLTP